MKVGKLGWLVAMFLSGGMAVAQGTADDYRRAYALKEKFSADKVFYSNVNPQWIEGTHQFWYVRNTPDGRLYVSVDADKKARKELFDSHRLAKALGAASGKEVKPEALALGHLPVEQFGRRNNASSAFHFIDAGHFKRKFVSRLRILLFVKLGLKLVSRRRFHIINIALFHRTDLAGSHLLTVR